jgi:dTDP-4-amino-4,6-dideoxygalactose transaminase
MSDVLAAFLYGQLEVWEAIQAKRASIWERYESDLGEWALKNGVRQPKIPEYCEQTYSIYYLLLPNAEERTRFIEFLRDRGVYAVFHYVPLHSSPMGKRVGGETFSCPVSEDISSRLVRLPLFVSMTTEEQDYVVDQVMQFVCGS